MLGGQCQALCSLSGHPCDLGSIPSCLSPKPQPGPVTPGLWSSFQLLLSKFLLSITSCPRWELTADSVFNTQMLLSTFSLILSPQRRMNQSPLGPRVWSTHVWRKWSLRKTLGLWRQVAAAPPSSSHAAYYPLSPWHCVPSPILLYMLFM